LIQRWGIALEIWKSENGTTSFTSLGSNKPCKAAKHARARLTQECMKSRIKLNGRHWSEGEASAKLGGRCAIIG
jgi:hypothetical protein